jgi:hypothetical protein
VRYTELAPNRSKDFQAVIMAGSRNLGDIDVQRARRAGWEAV